MPHLGPTYPRHPSPRHPPLPDSALAQHSIASLLSPLPSRPPPTSSSTPTHRGQARRRRRRISRPHRHLTATGCLTRAEEIAPFPSTLVWLVALSALSPWCNPSARRRRDRRSTAHCLNRDGFLDGRNHGIYGTRSWLKKKGCPPLYRSFLPPVPPSFAIPFRCTRHYLDRSLNSTGWLTQSLIPIADDDRRHHDLHQALSSLRSRLRLSHENPFKSFRSPPWTRGMFGERAYWWHCWVGHC
ncbi:hypothetical protein FB45DRAFT_1026229 [Roridomyces roridus]|uniref:Uncharacterized protein n=1 Tax=Roridomyces roridus TaxID=1738132 RepID=A0AAD7FSU2_9AGAR|nr:hypothetical protein FB45DRAFT_1026229 [Roridomyces roridus]